MKKISLDEPHCKQYCTVVIITDYQCQYCFPESPGFTYVKINNQVYQHTYLIIHLKVFVDCSLVDLLLNETFWMMWISLCDNKICLLKSLNFVLKAEFLSTR